MDRRSIDTKKKKKKKKKKTARAPSAGDVNKIEEGGGQWGAKTRRRHGTTGTTTKQAMKQATYGISLTVSIGGIDVASTQEGDKKSGIIGFVVRHQIPRRGENLAKVSNAGRGGPENKKKVKIRGCVDRSGFGCRVVCRAKEGARDARRARSSGNSRLAWANGVGRVTRRPRLVAADY